MVTARKLTVLCWHLHLVGSDPQAHAITFLVEQAERQLQSVLAEPDAKPGYRSPDRPIAAKV